MAHFMLEMDDASTAALTGCVDKCLPAKKLHLTMIHTTEQVPYPLRVAVARWLSDVGVWRATLEKTGISRDLPVDVNIRVLLKDIRQFDWYDGTKVWVVRLDPSTELQVVRRFLEAAFESCGVSWSRNWNFNPHISVCTEPTLTFIKEPPEALTFVRCLFHPGPKVK